MAVWIRTWRNIRGLFFTLHGNALVMTVTSQFWVIPTAGIAIYQPLFFQSMGISVTGYGFLMSIQQILQIIYNVPGSWLAVRIGKKWACIAADFAGWVVGSLLFMLANHPWELVGCLVVYNLWVVGNVAHECLLVDEVPANKMIGLFVVRQWVSSILPMIAVPFLSVYLMHRFGILNGVRLQFLGLAILVTIALLLRFKMLKEPSVNVPFRQNILLRKGAMRDVKSLLAREVHLRRSIFVSSALQAVMLMNDTYFSIFSIKIPGVTLGELGINAVVGGIMVWTSTPLLAQISHWREERILLIGIFLRFVAWIPIFTLYNFYGFVLYMILSNLGSCIITPSLTAWFANTTTEELRPTMYSVYNFISGGLLFMAPPLGGLLFSKGGMVGLGLPCTFLFAGIGVYVLFIYKKVHSRGIGIAR